MQLWKDFTVSSLQSACLAMHRTTMKTEGRQLQRACKTRLLWTEATVRARSEILGIWAALKQLSENKNDAMCIVLLRLMKTKISTWCFPFVNIATSPDRTDQSFSGWITLYRWKLPQNCASISSVMPLLTPSFKHNCEMFDSELGELRTPDGLADTCVSSGMAFWKGTERLANWSSSCTERETGLNEPTTTASFCLVSQEDFMPRSAEIIEPKLDDTQGGFRRGCSTTEQISTLQQIFEKSRQHAKDVYTCFVDLGKVYSRVHR